MQNLAIDVPFEIKTIETGKEEDGTEIGRFSGLASTFGNIDKVGDIIAPGAFAGSIRVPKKIKMLWMHDPSEGPIGLWEKIEETDKGLEVEGKLLLDVPRATQAHVLMKARALDSLSIGFRLPKNGAEFDNETGNRLLKKIELMEISVVTFPANPKARIGSVKGLEDIATVREFEAFLRDAGGFSVNQAKAIAAAGWQRGQSELRDEAGGLDELSKLLKGRLGIWPDQT